jgi:hypothetical protein
MAATLRSLITQYAGSDATNPGIAVAEVNANAYKGQAPRGRRRTAQGEEVSMPPGAVPQRGR